MATISSTGIGSGLDVTTIVRQLMAIENRPLVQLQTAETDLNAQLSSIGKLQSLTSSLRDSANALSSLSLWGQTTATSANPAAVTVSTSSGVVPGSYAIGVDHLAAGQTVSSAAFAGPTSTLSAGTLTIELGTWVGEPAPTGFTPKAGTAAVPITIGPGETSLEAIRDKINAADAGVSATLVNDANGTRLALRSRETGAENAFRVTVAESSDDGQPAIGLSALAYDATNGSSQLTRNQTAINASAMINGIAIESASNTLEGVIDGMTVNLLQSTEQDVEVGVATDTAAIREAINGFVKSFNDVAVYLREQTKYNPDNKTAGALQGDRLATGLQWQLRGLLNQGSTASSVYERLTDIGIGFGADGTLKVTSSRLDDALANLPELRKVLTTDGADAAGSGFIDRFKDFTALVLGSEGAFETRNASLKSMLDQNGKRQDALEQRLSLTEARLYKQYQMLDANLGRLSGISSYLTQQIALLNKSST